MGTTKRKISGQEGDEAAFSKCNSGKDFNTLKKTQTTGISEVYFGQGTKLIAGGMSRHQSTTVPPLEFHGKEQELGEGNRKTPIKQPSSTLGCPTLQEPPHIHLYCVLAH